MKFQFYVLIILSLLVSCREINLGNIRSAHVNTTGGASGGAVGGGGGGGGGSCTHTNSATSGQYTLGKNKYFFSQTNGVAFDSAGNMYTVNGSASPAGFMVIKHSPTGVYLDEFITAGAGADQLQNPKRIIIDGNEHLFIVDAGNNRIQKYDTSGNHLLSISTPNTPNSIDLLSNGNIIVAATDALLVFAPDGTPQPSIGVPGTGNGELSFATAVRVIANGNIYVIDNGRMQIFDSSGVYSSQFPVGNDYMVNDFEVLDDGTVFLGHKSLTGEIEAIHTFTSVGVQTGQFGSIGTNENQFNYGIGSINLGPGGLLYIGDALHSYLARWQTNGTFVDKLRASGSGNSQFNMPYGIVQDDTGALYVLEVANKRVQKFSAAGAYVSQFSIGLISSPAGIAIDSSRNIYIADQGTNQIEKFAPNGSHLGTIGATLFTMLNRVHIDASNNIYGVDAAGSNIRKFNASGTLTQTIGTGGTGDGEFSMPFDITTDKLLNLYVADAGNGRIQKLDPTGAYVSQISVAGMATAVKVTPCGDKIFVGNLVNGSIYKFDQDGTLDYEITEATVPMGLVGFNITRDGDLIIADTTRHIVNKISVP